MTEYLRRMAHGFWTAARRERRAMRKVLVLEDEPNIRSFVVINLKRAGYETIEAETGRRPWS